MDAHLFRRLLRELPDALIGLRVEKVYAPHPDCRVLTLYGPGRARHLTLLSTRQQPVLYVGQHRPVSPSGPFEPDSQTMRLRKYLKNRRILDLHHDWPRRRLALELAGEGPAFALLSLRDGLEIRQELPPDFGELPDWPTSDWPGSAELADLRSGTMPRERRFEQVLTPPLWRTCSAMLRAADDPADTLPELRALLVDLEDADRLCPSRTQGVAGGHSPPMLSGDGRGDVFLYIDADSRPCALSAWPLPQNLLPQPDLQETPYSDCLIAAERFGEAHTAALLGAVYQREESAPQRAEEKHLQRLLKKLESEQIRLSALVEGRNAARLIQMHLYHLDHDARLPEICLPNPLADEETVRIPLDVRFTIRENMDRLFHQADRGRRGLVHLAERRAQVSAALNAPELPPVPRPLHMAKAPRAKKTPQARRADPAKDISSFRSTDGLTLLRGRNATGNAALLRLAAGHDYWLHVQDSPSAHVLIRRDHANHPVPEATLLEAAQLCALKSPRRADTHVPVMLALVKHVQAIKGAPEGTVSVREVLRVLVITPDEGD